MPKSTPNTNDADPTHSPRKEGIPHLWLFWLGSGYDARAYSSRVLHFVDVARGDLVLVDGRADQSYVRDVARRRGIPRDRIFASQPSALPFASQLTQHETRRIGAWVRRHTDTIVLVPASTCTDTFAEFDMQLRRDAPADLAIEAEGEDLAWARLFGNKGFVHPRLREGERATSLWQRALGDGGSGDVRVPRGFLCRGKDEVREAWRRLGDASVALKEIDSSGGIGVHFLQQPADLDALEIGSAEIIVEEDLRLRHARLRFLTIHYDGAALGPVMEQLFMRDDATGVPGALYSGSRTIPQDTDVVRRIRAGMQRVVDRLRPTHVGGFDVAVGDDDALYVLDVNSARFNGSHTAMAAMAWRFPDQRHFACFKLTRTEPERFERLRERVRDLPWCEPVCYDGRTARWVVAGDSPAACAHREALLRERLAAEA